MRTRIWSCLECSRGSARAGELCPLCAIPLVPRDHFGPPRQGTLREFLSLCGPERWERPEGRP